MSPTGNGAGYGPEKTPKDEAQNEQEAGSHQAIRMLDHAMHAANANENEQEEPSASRWANRAPTEPISPTSMGGRPTGRVYAILPLRYASS